MRSVRFHFLEIKVYRGIVIFAKTTKLRSIMVKRRGIAIRICVQLATIIYVRSLTPNIKYKTIRRERSHCESFWRVRTPYNLFALFRGKKENGYTYLLYLREIINAIRRNIALRNIMFVHLRTINYIHRFCLSTNDRAKFLPLKRWNTL